MTEELAKHGLYFDYLYNLRVLDPNIAGETSDLKEKSGEYIESKNRSYFFFFFVSNDQFALSIFHYNFISIRRLRVARISKNHRRIHWHCGDDCRRCGTGEEPSDCCSKRVEINGQTTRGGTARYSSKNYVDIHVYINCFVHRNSSHIRTVCCRMKSMRKRWNWNSLRCNCNIYNALRPANRS